MAASPARSDHLALLAAGVVLLVVAVTAFAREASPEWARTQEDVRRTVAERARADLAAKVPMGLRQVWIPELSRVDRCIACHTTIEGGAALEGLPNPARSHPRPELLAAHPVEKFGCTLCHGGQGAATTKDAAHGDVDFWDEPLLSSARAARYGLTAAQLLETRCNTCHRAQETVEGMPFLTEAKALVQAKRCRSCHLIEGKGGGKGPELTRVGDAPPAHLVFPAAWPRPRTAIAWHVQHLLDPPSMSPGTEMEVKDGLTERQAVALALLVRSWRTQTLPPAWIPRAK